MPFVESGSLRDRLAHERRTSVAAAAQLVREVAGALTYAWPAKALSFARRHAVLGGVLLVALFLRLYRFEQMGWILTMRGRPVDALSWLDRAIRIDPLNPHWLQYDRALALSS